MTNPAYRILITKMAAELDQCHRLLMDDRRQRHPLADYARALLAEPDGPAVPDGREPASVATQLTEPEAVGPTAGHGARVMLRCSFFIPGEVAA